MDFGDATFTSFDKPEDWIKCFEQFPQIDPEKAQEGWYLGKIHSHHNMGVFHSGTDKNDLYETAPKLPMFLSLIVNYKCEADCELAIALEVEQKVLTVSKWKFKHWKKFQKESKIDSTPMTSTYVLKCEVEYEQEEWLYKQIEALKDRNKGYQVNHSGYSFDGYRGGYNGYGTQKDFFSGDSKLPKKQIGVSDKYSKLVYTTMLNAIPDLITLGTLENKKTAPQHVLREVDTAVQPSNVADYQDALKFYFIEEWWVDNFIEKNIDIEETLDAILDWIGNTQYTWLNRYIKETFNELKNAIGSLREVQGPGVVRTLKQV